MDEEKCTACGICASYCPVITPNPYDEYLSEQKAIHIPYTQAAPAAFTVNPDYCLFLDKQQCKQCTQTCGPGAIDFSQKSEVLTYSVGALILSPGFSVFNPDNVPGYRFAQAPNVVTGKEFERICCASGPYMGSILRPSDKKKPEKIALLQCVGSRDEFSGNPYCSSVCCKYAVKDAIVALEHEPDLDLSIFYIDMRLYGKGFEPFYERAKSGGVKFIRSRVSDVREDPESGDLTLRYVTEDGVLKENIFNMVVLSQGLEPPRSNSALALTAGFGLNKYGFCKTDLFTPLNTTKQGIFVAGAFQGPKAIPDSVVQASGTAGLAAEALVTARGTLISEKEYPPERSSLDESPKIGVFICHCGKNIAGVVDVLEVMRYAETLPDVAVVKDNLYSCSQDTQVLIEETIIDHQLNRIVVAACTPRTHEPLFQDTLKEAGLNRCMVEMVNIRDQCSWVHMNEKKAATLKSMDLVRMAVAKAKEIEPLPAAVIEVIPKGLIIGGGLSGMTAALSLARQGFECYLVEYSARLGGSLRNMYYTLEGSDPQKYLSQIIQEVTAHERIHVFTNTDIKRINGFVGNFRTALEIKNEAGIETVELDHGSIIIATGAVPHKPAEYLYGESDRVLLQTELEARLAKQPAGVKDSDHVVMIQCVGSRDETHPYCSSVCCGHALKNALKIKEINPETDVTILYRDMMAYGFYEDYYKAARECGVLFIQYDPENKPRLENLDEELIMAVYDPYAKKNLKIKADLLVLSTALEPTDNEALIEQLNVPLSADGFFLESHAQLKPVESYVDGIYLSGMAQFPKPIDERISQAKAAAAKAAILLGKGQVTAEAIVSSCDMEKCIGCGICENLCPFSAIRLVKPDKLKKAEVISAACKGCGVCASVCPTRAIHMGRFTDEQITAQIAAFGSGN